MHFYKVWKKSYNRKGDLRSKLTKLNIYLHDYLTDINFYGEVQKDSKLKAIILSRRDVKLKRLLNSFMTKVSIV